MDTRTEAYVRKLSRMIQAETVSGAGQKDKTKFYAFHGLLRELFPVLFSCCVYEDFDGSLLLRWPGGGGENPILLMHHHDVVEAPGEWTHPPFSGAVADGKLWGRGTLDTKGGLWAMLQAAEELAETGFIPRQDVYFLSDCAEEVDGAGADRISQELQRRGLRFAFALDEGGMILPEPIGGAKGTYAMVGVGEKGCADLKFIARSSGGHASTPGKDTPLVRLGKFMAAAERKDLFQADIPPAIGEMFRRISMTMSQPLKLVLGNPEVFRPLLLRVIPAVSIAAGAMLRTTLAFTMAQGAQGSNVLPQEAWVIGNMRYSHHQGRESSIQAVRRLADKFGIETVVLDAGVPSPLSDYESEAFALVERAVAAVYPGVITSPYLMTGASDSRFLSRVCDHCLRFAPFRISQAQMDSIHGIDECVDLATLTPAVDFYRYILTEA